MTHYRCAWEYQSQTGCRFWFQVSDFSAASGLKSGQSDL
ncbi:hypothetical protein D1AOALGA4SA_3851 [Olavius algarvensis Delta 1 endosymbiont]|nr:hypothetical protein D1AOALGA4SA_3851 [Olavius algarvensis Delta 1 endosymbiont]